MEVARSVFNHTFINPLNKAAIRERGIRAGEHMKTWIDEEIARRDPADPGEDMIGRLLAQGILDKEAVQRTIGGTFVGSIDTTTTVVAKLVKLASRNPDIEFAMRRDADDLHRLYGWCLDALRLWPHNPAILRSALVDTAIAGVGGQTRRLERSPGPRRRCRIRASSRTRDGFAPTATARSTSISAAGSIPAPAGR